MVMLTRSAYRRACESSESSDMSNKSRSVPPWCSSGKLYDRKKPQKLASPRWDILGESSYPLRENIWEYLYGDNNFHKRKCRKPSCKQADKNKRRWKPVIALALLLIGTGVTTFLWLSNKIPETNLVSRIIPRKKLIALLGWEHTSVAEECCYKMKHLAEALLRTEEALRNALRIRRSLMLTAQTNRYDFQGFIGKGYVKGASVRKGVDTREWGVRVALWGVVPLWRTAPPPDTVLAMRKPVPSDCWPFSGSEGEMIIDLPRKLSIRGMSVEHVRPDTARSAPKRFTLYGVLENSTWIKAVDGEYKYRGPAKQYYPLMFRNIELRRVVFRVLSNQGNKQYTCVYRVHLYEAY